MKILRGLVITVLLTGCGAGEPAGEVASLESEQGLNVETAYGPVQGTLEGDVRIFKGIRYGKDTATTRFAAPAEPAVWSVPQPATQFGAACPQTPTGNPGGLFTSWAPESPLSYDEDCLFLNVWTPNTETETGVAQRPVMVWFHGGGFASGSGSSRAYDGKRLAQRGDVVVVTVNHRLNVFGYLALAHFGPEFADSSVAGVLDMILSLQWVKNNIAAFGGDPRNVTIFGESGGGAKVTTLMNSDAAKGLFHRAIAQSGVVIRYPERADAEAAADQVVQRLGLNAETIDQIRTLPTADIQAAFKDTGAANAPSLDGRILVRHPFDPGAPIPAQDVPFMLGTNRTESSLFSGAANPASFDLTWETLPAALQRTYPDKDVDAVIAGYRALQPDSAAPDLYFEITTDARWLAGHVLAAEHRVAQGAAPTYQYLFNWDTPVDGGRWRSPHALEIGFVFDNVAYSESFSGVGEVQQKVADVMADTWIAFARTGDPNHPGIPEWPAYNLEQRPVMVLDESPELVNNARGAQLELINEAQAYGARYSQP